MVVADVQEVFASAGHAVLENMRRNMSQWPRNTSKNTSLQQQSLLTRNSGQVWQDIAFNGSWAWLIHSLCMEGRRKTFFMTCQRWCPQTPCTDGNWDGRGSGGGRPKKITGAVAEKLTVLTHDMLFEVLVCWSRWCVTSWSALIWALRLQHNEAAPRCGLGLRMWCWPSAASWKSGAWTRQGRTTLTRHVFAWARLAVTAGGGKVRTKNWRFRDHRNRLSLSLWSPVPCGHRLLPSAFSFVPLRVWCTIWPQTSGWLTLTIIGRPRKLCGSCSRRREWWTSILQGRTLCCAHGHGAFPHQCWDRTDVARGVRPHSPHYDPPHTTSFLQPCDVGLMRPFKCPMRWTVCEN